jgi:hypothetical protein
MMPTVTEERPQDQELPEEEPRIEAEWIPVSDWPEDARAIIEDIEQIQRVLTRMRGGPSLAQHEGYLRAMQILDAALIGRRLELSAIIIGMHGGDQLSPPGTVGTGR